MSHILLPYHKYAPVLCWLSREDQHMNSFCNLIFCDWIVKGCTLLGEAPSCTSLNRLQCANETDTVCGPCIHGFKSVNNNTGQCVAVSCGYPPHKPNASPSSTQELYYGDTVTYTCDHGTATGLLQKYCDRVYICHLFYFFFVINRYI